ncbi:MAG: tRNA (adenosine(37)-N6)-threonylcarbamoyltransferase complex dimerization subunit type 1 TsaB [Pseudomonas putida]|jgi:tRNA threonylcarbamoyladenosine biosynthesis protein TsaB|nr:tRNA (adenosine(37)-N6)-threonylcarbamoyltransferase complex dimerization subunit type 1 TsaB [Pseudomonas putida]
MTTLLALDTATEACSVALLHDGKVTSHYEVIPRMHAQKLLPMIKQLLAESGVALSDVEAIAFGRGPGAFTGVRIAIGVVQGLAFALERPVLPVSNLAALAQGALRERGVQHVAAAIDARMDEVYWGCYQAHEGEMRLVGCEAVLPPERAQLPDASTGEWFGVGTGWGYGERLAVAVNASDASLLPNALDILELARFAWARGEAIPAEQAQPVYLRDNVATPKAR